MRPKNQVRTYWEKALIGSIFVWVVLFLVLGYRSSVSQYNAVIEWETGGSDIVEYDAELDQCMSSLDPYDNVGAVEVSYCELVK